MNQNYFLSLFLLDHPEQRAGLQTTPNESGLPLHPSGLYAFWAWQCTRELLSAYVADTLCESLVKRFGEGVKYGKVTSWEPFGSHN